MRFINPGLLAGVSQQAAALPIGREAIRQVPVKDSGGESLEQLADGLTNYLADKGKPDVNIEPRIAVPKDTFIDKAKAVFNQDDYFHSGRVAGDPNTYGVAFNPNADRHLLAHELGHVASQQTDVGRLMSDLRHHPYLKDALTKAALLTVPAGAVAALTQGDDDLAAGAALAYTAAAPTILDEVLATHHGLGIMNRANLAPTLGGRAKLAGGLLSYMATPLAMAGAANAVGNLMDDELVGPLPNY